jgi:hypothetical protein
MLLSLPYDMLIEMVQYLVEEEFMSLFISVNDDKCIQNELKKSKMWYKCCIQYCPHNKPMEYKFRLFCVLILFSFILLFNK